MAVAVLASAIRTCFGDGVETFDALLAGQCGAGGLRHVDGLAINVDRGYHRDGDAVHGPAAWLGDCVADAAIASGVIACGARVAAVVGTGLGQTRAVERWDGTAPFDSSQLHYRRVVHAVLPKAEPVLTIANACSASGSAIAIAQDMLELDEADVVIAAGADGMSTSMLAMIGRIAESPTERVRPFDVARTGVLLGDGAASVVLTREADAPAGTPRVLATGLSCDAADETAPSVEGIVRCIDDALRRAAVDKAAVDLVVAHGTGTELNDPAEAAALEVVFGSVASRPLVTAVKGAVGHTSGAAALVNLDVALRVMRGGVVPPIVGLDSPIVVGGAFSFVTAAPEVRTVTTAMVNAFGFGGVNAVTVLSR